MRFALIFCYSVHSQFSRNPLLLCVGRFSSRSLLAWCPAPCSQWQAQLRFEKFPATTIISIKPHRIRHSHGWEMNGALSRVGNVSKGLHLLMYGCQWNTNFVHGKGRKRKPARGRTHTNTYPPKEFSSVPALTTWFHDETSPPASLAGPRLARGIHVLSLPSSCVTVRCPQPNLLTAEPPSGPSCPLPPSRRRPPGCGRRGLPPGRQPRGTYQPVLACCFAMQHQKTASQVSSTERVEFPSSKTGACRGQLNNCSGFENPSIRTAQQEQDLARRKHWF